MPETLEQVETRLAPIAAAAGSHVGRVRRNNQDSGYSGQNLFIVCDGVGGHSGGDVASAIAVKRIADADHVYETAEDAGNALLAAMQAANALIIDTVGERPELARMATTGSALLWVEGRFVVGHIGDSRIYRLRGSKFTQISVDHTFVQKLVEMGRITPAEALTHPRRSVVMRVLGDIEEHPEIDIEDAQAKPGDRFVVCSDGLSSYVETGPIVKALTRTAGDPQGAVDALIKLALDNGAPDNVTVCVIDLGEVPVDEEDPQLPTEVVGSAASSPDFETEAAKKPPSRIPSMLLHPITTFSTKNSPTAEFHHEPSDDYLQQLIHEARTRRLRRRLIWTAFFSALVAILVIATLLAYSWTQGQYYVGIDEHGLVAIYQGVHAQLGPIELSHVVEETSIDAARLPVFHQTRLEQTISVSSLEAARDLVDRLRSV